MDEPMDTISISKFKATCLAVLERVNRTGRRVRVTRFGEPVADVVPSVAPRPPGDWLGSLRTRAHVTGDIIEPIAPAGDWDALQDK